MFDLSSVTRVFHSPCLTESSVKGRSSEIMNNGFESYACAGENGESWATNCNHLHWTALQVEMQRRLRNTPYKRRILLPWRFVLRGPCTPYSPEQAGWVATAFFFVLQRTVAAVIEPELLCTRRWEKDDILMIDRDENWPPQTLSRKWSSALGKDVLASAPRHEEFTPIFRLDFPYQHDSIIHIWAVVTKCPIS